MRAASPDLQKRILRAIEVYTSRHGKPPTIREIGKAVGVASSSHVLYHLTVLEKQGHITRASHESRGIQLTKPAAALLIEGRIAAGGTLDSFSEGECEPLDFGIPSRYGPHQYALQVHGDSMIEDGIFDGDHVIVRQAAEAHNGEIVVALHLHGYGERGAVTLKRFYKEPEHGRVRLQPANVEIEPRYIPADEWAREWCINGVVIAIYRPCPPRP